MPKSTKEEAALLAKFARERGISLRTARNYRTDPRTGGPREAWIEWLRRGAGNPLAEVPAREKPDWERAREAADDAYALLRRLQAAAHAAEDDTTRAVCARGIREARRLWEDARKDAERLAERAGVLVPVAAVETVLRRASKGLGMAQKSWANNVAAALRPEWRPAFFNAVRSEQRTWNAYIQRLDVELSALLKPC